MRDAAGRNSCLSGLRCFARTASALFDAASFENRENASCTVVMNCAEKMIVEFFSLSRLTAPPS